MNQDQASRMAEEAGATIFDKDGSFGSYQAGSVLFTPAEWGKFAASIVKLTQGQEPDPQLCKFYQVTTYPDLVAAQAHHIDKLQSKLPPPLDEQLGKTRFA